MKAESKLITRCFLFNRFCLLFVLGSFLTSCSEVQSHAKGTVYVSGTNTPYPNALVMLKEAYSHAGDENSIASAITGADGKYRIGYNRVGGRSYYVIACNEVSGSGETKLKLGSSMESKDFSLARPAFLKIYANKTSSSNNYILLGFPDDTGLNGIFFSPKTASPYSMLIHASYVQLLYSNLPKDSPCFFMPPNSSYRISWTVYDNSGPTTTVGQMLFNANSGDTVSYTINFN